MSHNINNLSTPSQIAARAHQIWENEGGALDRIKVLIEKTESLSEQNLTTKTEYDETPY